MIGGNILRNASFEGTLSGWASYGTGATMTVENDATKANSGVKSLKVVGAGGSGLVQGAWMTRPEKLFEPGQNVSVSVFVKGAPGSVGLPMALFVPIFDVNFVYVGLQYVGVFNLTSAYQRVSGTITSDIRFRPGVLVTGPYETAFTMNIDDVQIEQGGVVTPFFVHKDDRPAGAMVTRDNQYEFNNILSGRLTPLVMTDVEGLLSTPELLEIDTERQDSPGTFGQVAYPTSRVIAFDISGSFMSALLAEEARAMLEQGYLIEEGVYRKFCFSRPYYPVRYVWAQMRKRHFVSNYDVAHGLLTGSVSMYAADPRIYSLALRSQSLVVPNLATSAAITVANVGNYKAPFKITIPGPCTNPVITNDRTSRALRLDVVLTGGQTLTIDTKTQTVQVDGVESFTLLSNDNEWFSLLPGDNLISLVRSVGAAQINCVIDYRDVWM